MFFEILQKLTGKYPRQSPFFNEVKASGMQLY